MKMKSVIVLVCALFSFLGSYAQYETEFTITDLGNDALSEKVQSTLSNLITELNLAQAEKRNPKLSGLGLDEPIQNSIMAMWETSAFRCMETEVIEAAMTIHNGEYEVRNIPFIFTDLAEDDQYHEVAVTFNAQGNITSFHMVIAQNLYYQVLKKGKEVTDFQRRLMILDYVEQFRTAYNTKDLQFLNQVFSDDALIITGKVIKAKPSEMNIPDRIIYKKQGKQEYLSNLKRVFNANKRIRVSFDEIEVMRHPVNVDFYGVTLHQGYSSDNYSDDGYLFLLWDFTDQNQPQIHVRTWQPDKLNGSKLPKEEIFSVSDFDI